MKLLVALGNPGKQYERTRHNVGFLVLDMLMEREGGFGPAEHRFDAEIRRGKILGEDCLAVKPLTYMNLSGNSVGPLARFYKVDPSNIIVIHDDIDQETNKVKARAGGGHGGHNGVRHLLEVFGGQDFHRIKIGVGRPQVGEVRDWVLSPMTPNDLETLRNDVVEQVYLRLKSIFQQTK